MTPMLEKVLQAISSKEVPVSWKPYTGQWHRRHIPPEQTHLGVVVTCRYDKRDKDARENSYFPHQLDVRQSEQVAEQNERTRIEN